MTAPIRLRITNSFAAMSLAVLTAATTSCVTTPEKTREPTPEVAPQQDKPGAKTSEVPAPVAEPAKPITPPVPTATEQLDFVKRQSEADASFGEREQDFVTRLSAQPEAGSIEEAALVLGLLGSATHPLGINAPAFEEADIGDAANTRPTGNGMSLEKMSKERNVNLADAVNENPWLKNYGTARHVYQATRVTSDSDDFKKELINAVSREATRWLNLAQEMGLAPAATTTAPVAAATLPEPIAPQDLPPPNPADLRGGDAILAEAQSLADRGNFEAAIKKAGAVAPTSPMFATSQEKIRDFSNLAVQDLRRKAAQAFQSAMPVTDVKVRAQYLQQAKQYLEQAIKEYPAATQLPTVRDNLRVISRDLEKLEAERR